MLNKRCTIAYFVYNLNSYSGAANQAFILSKKVNENIIIFNHERSAKRNIEQISDTVQVVNLPNNYIASFFIMMRVLLNKNIKILHLHGFFRHGIIIGKLIGKKIILKSTLMGSDDFYSILNRKYQSRYFNNILLNMIDVNICLTESMNIINKKYISNKKILTIPNGVEISKKINKQKKNIFCFVGLICERKKTYESIEYFIRHYQHEANSIMYVVGPYNGVIEADNEYYDKCKRLVEKNECQKKIIFTGNLTKKEVADIFSKAKSLLFFSKQEGMPNVVLEAMSHNCVPITDGLGGIMNEILNEELFSKLVVENYQKKIDINSIDVLLNDAEVYELVKNEYAVDIIADKYCRLYSYLLV